MIDTNAVIEFLGGVLPASGSNWMDDLIDKKLHHLSVINQIELLGFNGSSAEMQTIKDFIDVTNVLPLLDVEVQKTIDLRKTHKIKLPDAIIAATALVHDLTLLSRNLSDFQYIDDLKVINPHEQ